MSITIKEAIFLKTYSFIKSLKNIKKEDQWLAGGKGANLGEMINADLPVPGGFVLLTTAYKRFVQVNGLQKKIDSLIEKIDTADDHLVEGTEISDKIEALFEQNDIPEDILAEIESLYQYMGQPKVAIRSSATAEDLPGTSFAGQYETYLNVMGFEQLCKYIKKCWASLWNLRALSYRIKQKTGNIDLAHGVVVQELIDADKSGILFTANPVNGRRDQMLLNASWGLGEAVVGGEVTPDQWILDKHNHDIITEQIAKKEIMTIRQNQGIQHVEVPTEKQEKVSLAKKEVLQLLQLGSQVENYYEFPQDIEWAIKDGELFLLQTRPITSLYPVPEKVEGKEGLRVNINFSLLSQGIEEPLTPMGENLFIKMFLEPAKLFNKGIKDERDMWWIKGIGGRVFVDLTDLLRKEKHWDKVMYNDLFSDQDPLTAKVLHQFLERNKQAITREKSKINSWIIKHIAPALKLAYPMVKNSLYGKMQPIKARDKAIAEWNQIVEEIKKEREVLTTIEDKLAFIEKHVGNYTLEGFGILSYIAPSNDNVEKAEKIAGRYLKDTSNFRLVEKSLPHNSTTEMGLALLEIAKKMDEQGRKPKIADEEIQSFLAKYGHRSIQEMDIGVPRWHEEPEYVISVIESYMENQNYQQGLNNFYQGQREAEAAIDRIKQNLEQAGADKKAKQVEKLIRNYREIFGLREHSKFIQQEIYQIFRELLKEIGEALVSEGKLNDKMDVFWVRFHDILSGEKLQAVVEANQAAQQRYENLFAPRILASTGESIFSAIEEHENALTGVPVSAGVYEGKVKVIYSPKEGYKLEQGDILVTKATNPAWTPLFLNLGAIIMETGGPISHGAVVAREYGIPAVVAVGEATSKLKDGEIIRVNGETGSIQVLEGQA